MKKSILPAILLSGLIVGTNDITLACLNAYIKNRITPDKLLRTVASGVFGNQAFAPGMDSMIFFGLLFHYIIALGFTAIFFYIYPKIKWFSTNKIATGILYGLIVWTTMNFIVVPLSNRPVIPFQLKNVLIHTTILIVAIGIPLSFLANKFYTTG